MAHAHETQAKISLLKKSPATHAKGFCTVRNILRVQSETFCMYSQKHSACTVGKIPAVLAEKSSQYTRKKICKCAKKCYFGMKFTQITRISRFAVVCAVLFCVCGAMSAWGETFYWNPAKNYGNYDWKAYDNWLVYDRDRGRYTTATSYPGENGTDDDAVFGGGRNGVKLSSDSHITVILDKDVNLRSMGSQFVNNDENITINITTEPEQLTKPTIELTGAFALRLYSGSAKIKNINFSLGVNVKSSSFDNVAHVSFEVVSECSATFTNTFTVAQDSTVTVNGTLEATTITNNGTFTNAGTLNLNDGTFANTATGIWNNTGAVNVTSGDFTNNGGRINENGTWLYSTSRNGIADIRYHTLSIGTGANVEISDDLVATYILMNPRSKLDLVGHNMYTDGISSSGRISLYGTQEIKNVARTDWAVIQEIAEVEFYGKTTDAIIVSKMAGRGLGSVDFTEIICDLSSENYGKILDFTGVKRTTRLTLKGNSTNKLVITASEETILSLSESGSGSNLRVDYKNVQLTGNGTPYTLTDSLGVGETKTTGVRNGWNFGGVAEYYFWNAGDGDWNKVDNWLQADDLDETKSPRVTASYYPGNAGGTSPTTSAKVYIETISPVAVNLNIDAQINEFTANQNAVINIGNNTLSVGDATTGNWNNSGKIILGALGSVNFGTNVSGARFVENGTWQYTGTRTTGIVQIEYNNLEIGDGTASPTVTLYSAVTAKDTITVLTNAKLAADTNNITASSITNNGTFDTAGNTINANNITNSGTFTATGTQAILGKAGAPSVTQITNSNTMEFANVTVNGSLTNNANSNASFSGNANITDFVNYASGNTTNVTFGSNATVTNFTNSGTVNFTGATPTINITSGTNSGTVTIDGNPNSTVNVTNSTNSTVNYTLTKADSANVNFGTTYGNLVCEPNASNKTLNFNKSITVNGNLTLNGTIGNLLTIDGSNAANITLARANQSGSYLKINHDHVSINSTGFSPYYNVGKTSTDGIGTIPIGNMHGWLFELQDDYYWFGGDSNWGNSANWRFSNSASSPAPAPSFYPGNAGSTPPTTGAKVHITPTAANTTVTLNTTASVSSIEMNGYATLAIGANNLTVRNSWSNNGIVTIANGSATLPSGATDNGTWTYNNTSPHDLVNISYNILNLNGTGTITPIAAITANRININNGTILALGANNLTVRNLWTNNGIVTVTSGNATLPANAQDNGTWTYNNTSNRDIIGNISYNNLNLNGPGWIIPQSNISAKAKIAIGSDGILDLAGRNISAANITNNGRVRLYGTQNVGGTVANEPNSTVEYYGDTYATPININRFGSTYGNFIMRGYNKTLNVNESIAVNGDLVLQGKDVDNMLTVTRTASGTATITVYKPQASSVTANPPAGNFIAMQRRNIYITGTKIGDYKGSPYYYYAENSYDLDDYNVDVLRNGWRFKPVISLENISFTLTSIGSNRFYFRTTPANMAELGNVPTKLFDMLLHRYFAVVTPKSPLAPNATLKIDAATAPQRITNGSNLAWIGLSLTNNISLQDLQNFYIRADKQTEVNQYSFHALSDFAIDVVAPRYAFDNRHLDSGNAEEAAGGVAIRNWDRDQESNGQLVTKSDITISAGQNVDGLGVPVIYFDASPDAASVSTSYNSDAGGDWRIWLPQAFTSLSPVANSDYITFEEGGSVGGNSLRFDLPVTKGEKFSSWKAGDQISFLFELKDANGNGMTVCHEPVLNGTVLNVSATAPLYALRLQVPEDITTLDLWSFKLRDIKSQRGSITIMNNVINVLSGENMILDVNVPVSGVLNIMVMTLDGTIVKYLQHGNVSQGKHVYHWDGRNNAGKPVARGLYFIRIVGCTIDESRKVMAVWK